MKVKKKAKKIIGWREWVGLPDLEIERVKVKVDTGAKSSCLHAEDIKFITRKGLSFVQFKIYPLQYSDASVTAASPLVDFRRVRSSNGQMEERPVILTTIKLMEIAWPIEVTLTRRDMMGFRMLLGRQALKGQFLINPGRSFLGLSEPPNPA